MTKCPAYWNKVLQFKKKDDFPGFCDWCGEKDESHLYEDWKIVDLYKKLQICNSDLTKVPADALRPLIRKQNEVLVPQTLKKIESFVKGGNQLTRKKVEEFMFGKYRTVEKKAVLCAYCGLGTYNPVKVKGLNFCSEEHSEKADEILARLEKLSQPQRTVKHEYKPKDKWEHRAARMKISPSKMDEDVFTLAKQNKELKDMGWEVIFQKPYILTVSDLTLKRGDEEKAFFNDHEETHKNKRDADREKREILMKFRPNVQAIGIDYGSGTKPVDILKQIVGAVKGAHQDV